MCSVNCFNNRFNSQLVYFIFGEQMHMVPGSNLISSADQMVSGADQIGYWAGVRRRPSVNNCFKCYLLLQFSVNLNQTWLKVRTHCGAKFVGSGILNFRLSQILGGQSAKFYLLLKIYLLLQFSPNVLQIWCRCRPDRGSKIVGSRILNFCLCQILGAKLQNLPFLHVFSSFLTL